MTPKVTGNAEVQKILWSPSMSLISVVYMPKKLVTNDLERLISYFSHMAHPAQDSQRKKEESNDGENANGLSMAFLEDLDALLQVGAERLGDVLQ